jgi:hypothetical protein
MQSAFVESLRAVRGTNETLCTSLPKARLALELATRLRALARCSDRA